jgi:hypothetical protein
MFTELKGVSLNTRERGGIRRKLTLLFTSLHFVTDDHLKEMVTYTKTKKKKSKES